MHILMAQMAALKHGIPNEETESRNEVRSQNNINDRKILYKNSLTLKMYKTFPLQFLRSVDVYHKDKPVQK